MSKRQFKSQASSTRAAPTAGFANAFSSNALSFGTTFGSGSTVLSYLGEQPNLTLIIDPNVVVNFKNISKKDSTTKAKALEDLQSHVLSLSELRSELEEPFLDAWVRIFPRTSIDLARRVRQDAYVLNGHICLSSGKRIARHMPDLIGAWMAGLHDGDKSVMRAAQEALHRVFPTQEKRANLMKVYHSSILKFATEALQETPTTLSDDRTTTREDADAKFSRVFSSNIAVIDTLLNTLPEKEIEKQEILYRECISSELRWTAVASQDTGIRRSIFGLLRTVLTKKKDWIQTCLPALSASMFSKQTISSQSGSSIDFVETLTALSLSFPSIWETGKERDSCAIRLGDLAKSGSQGGSAQFWQNLLTLFGSIPALCLPTKREQISKLLKQVHGGIIRKDEPRAHVESAWNCYVGIVKLLSSQLDTAEQVVLLEDTLFPIIRQYISPVAENSQWSLTGPRAAGVMTTILRVPSMYIVAEAKWPEISADMLQRIQTSSPEQSKDHQASQVSLVSEGGRFFALESEILKDSIPSSFLHVIRDNTGGIISRSQDVLMSRGGKPYGAAGVIDAAVRSLSPWLFQQSEIIESLMSFVCRDVPQIISSPSRNFLVSILYECQHQAQFSEAWNATLDSALEVQELSLKLTTLRLILSSPRMPTEFREPAKSQALQDLIVEQVRSSIAGNGEFAFMNDVLAAPTRAVSEATTERILSVILEALGVEKHATNALTSLDIILQRDPELLQSFVRGPAGSTLLQNLLLLTEASDDELASFALNCNRTLERFVSHDGKLGSSSTSILKILERGLYEATTSSLSIDTLVELAQKSAHLTEVLPSTKKWTAILESFLQKSTLPALALTNSLGGAIYLAHHSRVAHEEILLQRDRDGYSNALRIALYTVKLSGSSHVFPELDCSGRSEIYILLSLTVQLVSDKLSLFESNDLWLSHDITTEIEMLDFISEAHLLLTKWRNTGRAESLAESTPVSSFLETAHEALFQKAANSDPTAFHKARAYATSVSELNETFGSQQFTALGSEEKLRKLRKSNVGFQFVSFVAAHKARLSSTPSYTRACNELIAELTAENVAKSPAAVLEKLVYVNTMILDQEQVIDTVAKQRIVFFVKHMTTWLSDEATDMSLEAEVCKALSVFLPHMKDIYGTHWSAILTYLVKALNSNLEISKEDVKSTTVPWLYASMRLADVLRNLTLDAESNDDLKDAWQEGSVGLSSGLMYLLIRLGHFPDELNQPLQIVNGLLGRQIQKISLSKIENIEEMYPLMGSASQRVQNTAFNFLHKHIPTVQEQISVEIVLEKKSARLPDELLSLIIEAPSFDSLVEVGFDRMMPLPLQSYLSSWLLVFDHFVGASDKVKTDYIGQLREGDYLKSLLNLVFELLGHGGGKPIDASKFDIATYNFGVEETPMKDIQWLLIHLYYLCLRRIPALTKSWWMECKSRQIVVNVETWTEKYISPLIIVDALNTVNEWSEAQDAASDEAIIVKVNQRTKEIVVSKELDDQMMSMAIRLPSNFPLGQAVLHGVNRVAVDEKKWRSWLLNSQGVITFSNNSLIDGIIAFRRNVVGALKGQTECAICYSIVGADKQLPTKRCGTCKNLFHGSCLYRWFKSSNSSSCPLCRNPFNYT